MTIISIEKNGRNMKMSRSTAWRPLNIGDCGLLYDALIHTFSPSGIVSSSYLKLVTNTLPSNYLIMHQSTLIIGVLLVIVFFVIGKAK